jgi:hypothetical protein
MPTDRIGLTSTRTSRMVAPTLPVLGFAPVGLFVLRARIAPSTLLATPLFELVGETEMRMLSIVM